MRREQVDGVLKLLPALATNTVPLSYASPDHGSASVDVGTGTGPQSCAPVALSNAYRLVVFVSVPSRAVTMTRPLTISG